MLICKSTNYYRNLKDILSHRPILFGYDYPHLEGPVCKSVRTHGDFLLNIGEDIGMTPAPVLQSTTIYYVLGASFNKKTIGVTVNAIDKRCG